MQVVIFNRMIKIKYPLLLVIFSLASFNLFAQVETKNPTSEFIFRGRHYIPGSPWLNVGAGYGYNFTEEQGEPNFFVDMHYQLKSKHCLGLGFATSRDQILDSDGANIFLPHNYVRHSTNSLHTTYGRRIERMGHNLGFFIGPAYNWGYIFDYTDADGQDFHSPYGEFGVYANINYSYKLFYDVGVGASLWASYCNSYSVVGLSLHLYFSTAFKRQL